MALMKEFRTVILGGIGGVLGVVTSKYLLPDLTFVDDRKIDTSSVENSKCDSIPRNSHRILKYGTPSCFNTVLEYENHVLEYDPARRVPKWVAEHISEKNVLGSEANRKLAKFDSDPQIPTGFASENRDFWGSGWSRGHMAPAGNNKHSQAAMNQTFYLSNIVPQDIDNNGNYWNRLEIYCRDLTKKYSDVYIISGPLWLPELEDPDQVQEEDPAQLPIRWKNKSMFQDKVINSIRSFNTRTDQTVTSSGDSLIQSVGQNPNTVGSRGPTGDGGKKRLKPPRKFVKYQVLGKNNVAVPTHLFKIILVEDPLLQQPMMGAFIIPNKPVQNVPLEEFEVEIEEVEKHVGVRFHQDLDQQRVSPLCLGDGCKLNSYHEFQHFYWNRQMSSSWNLHNLERDWKVVCERGLKSDKLERLYLQKKQEFLEKANKKNEKTKEASSSGDENPANVNKLLTPVKKEAMDTVASNAGDGTAHNDATEVKRVAVAA